MTIDDARAKRSVAPAVVLGVGLGAFVDGIVREVADPMPWTIGFLALSALLFALGLWLAQRHFVNPSKAGMR